MSVEEHSYVFLAAGALLIRRAPGRVTAAVFLVASTLAVLVMNKYYYSHPPSGATPWFLRSETASLGLLAAAAIRVLNGMLPERWAKPMWLLPVFAFAIGVFCFTDYAHGLLKYTAGPILLAYSINHLQQAPVAIRDLFSMSILRKFGLASFSIYLWQQPFYYLVRDFGYSSWQMFIAAIAVGFASFYAFEDPIRHLLNRKWAERKEAKVFAAWENLPAKVGS